MPQTACATIATATSFRPCTRPAPAGPLNPAGAIGKQHQRDRRGQRETGPGRQRAKIASAHQAEREADLAAGWAGQELAERDQIRIGLLVEPVPAGDEFVAEIADMGDRAPEATDAELEENQQHLERRVCCAEMEGGAPGRGVSASFKRGLFPDLRPASGLLRASISPFHDGSGGILSCHCEITAESDDRHKRGGEDDIRRHVGPAPVELGQHERARCQSAVRQAAPPYV